MVTVNNEILTALGELYRLCRESQIRLHNALSNETAGGIRTILSQYADQREDIVTELRALLERLGTDPEGFEPETPNLDAEGETFDEAPALRAYEEILEKDLPAEIRDVVERQNIQIAEAADHISEVKGMGLASRDGNSDSRPDKEDERRVDDAQSASDTLY